MKISGIYKISSIKKPERCYIGSAKNIQNRWMTHLYYLEKNKHHSRKLQNHYNKYGKNDLIFSILLGCDEQDLIITEQYFIDGYKPWFNICLNAGSQLGNKRSEEVCKKIGERHKGQRAWNKGIKTGIIPKSAFKKKQEPWNKGLKTTKPPWNKGTKGVVKAWNKGKKYHFHNQRDNFVYKGRITSEETKAKLRAKAIGRKLPEWAVENLRLRLIGNKNMLGRPVPEETKKKISEGLKRYFASKRLNKFDLITNN